jgi:hypothetical protein
MRVVMRAMMGALIGDDDILNDDFGGREQLGYFQQR